MTKTNPHRRPATQADVRKARNEGIRIAFKICMFVLRNYFGFGEKRLTRFWEYVYGVCNEIGTGQAKEADLDQALIEYNIRVTL